VVASVAGVEVVRVRPVLAERTASAPEATHPPTSIEDILKQPEQHPTPAQDPAPEDATSAPPAKTAAVAEPARVAAGPFQVQVGAYPTQGEAERQLTLVRQRAGSIVGERATHLTQVRRGEKTFFRARYVGFDGRPAADTVCSELKRLEIDCFVMKAE
jgi:hypothetical protein